MVLSARSLPYAQHCLSTLVNRALEPMELHLITDGEEDAKLLREAMAKIGVPAQHPWAVSAQSEVDARAEDRLRSYPRIQEFRRGHPCWRKVTDPALFAADGEEMVILDPDLYFPNPFTFEPTPDHGLLLMWQRPNCLLPPECVRRAIGGGYRLADHVDIGVANVRAPIDWDFADRLVGILGGRDIPRVMHVEAIMWAALAMHAGGGYLDPASWVCWHRTQLKRVMLKMGAGSTRMLRLENISRAKCFHAGGIAKHWIAETGGGALLDGPPGFSSTTPSPVKPFKEMHPRKYEMAQMARGALRCLGYYRIFGAK
jgi:hypothetical protein